MMQRQHRDRRCEPDAGSIGGHIGQHKVRAGQHAQRIEVMLTDPGRMHAKLLGVECLGSDVGDELIRGAGIVFIVVVTEREIPEVHGPSSWLATGGTSDIATVADAIDNATVAGALIQKRRIAVKALRSTLRRELRLKGLGGMRNDDWKANEV